MILLLDIGNTQTHLGLATRRAVRRRAELPTLLWKEGSAARQLRQFVGPAEVEGAALCSVVPEATALARRCIQARWAVSWLELNHQTARGPVGLDYPRPETIGPDRLANVIAARHYYGAPCLAIDFGTAVTFDVVDGSGNFVGGIIAPGLAVMTRYLHEQTALLPAIQIRPVRSLLGRSTEQAMRIAAVQGYRGMVRELIRGLRRELRTRRLPVVATGGYARLMASSLPEITSVKPNLTLEGLRLAWQSHQLEP
jgi:type III pantothenate kinase